MIIMKDNTLTLGKLVYIYRQNNLLKQEFLAESVGISQSTLSDIENDKYIVTVPLLLKLAEALKVTPSKLLPDSDTNTFNNSFADNAVNNGANILHQNINFEEERNALKELVKAKDEIIKLKDEMLMELKRKKE
jgi:transcriptional regulator with XRE-family HTH domain